MLKDKYLMSKWFFLSLDYRFIDLSTNFIFFNIDYIYQPLRSGRMWHKVNFFKRSLTGLNSEFSFS